MKRFERTDGKVKVILYLASIDQDVFSTHARFSGRIEVGTSKGEGRFWSFSDLSVPFDARGIKGTIDRATREICGFATYYTTDNRSPDELPDWAPSAEFCDLLAAE